MFKLNVLIPGVGHDFFFPWTLWINKWSCKKKNKTFLYYCPILSALICLFYLPRRFAIPVLPLVLLPLISERMNVSGTALRTPVGNNFTLTTILIVSPRYCDKPEMQRSWITCWGSITNNWQSQDTDSHGLAPEPKLLTSELTLVRDDSCIPDIIFWIQLMCYNWTAVEGLCPLMVGNINGRLSVQM